MRILFWNMGASNRSAEGCKTQIKHKIRLCWIDHILYEIFVLQKPRYVAFGQFPDVDKTLFSYRYALVCGLQNAIGNLQSRSRFAFHPPDRCGLVSHRSQRSAVPKKNSRKPSRFPEEALSAEYR